MSTNNPTPWITRSGLPSRAVGRIRNLATSGYNAREIVRLTGYEPADVRRVIYDDSERDRGSEFQTIADGAKEMIEAGFDEKIVRACFGGA